MRTRFFIIFAILTTTQLCFGQTELPTIELSHKWKSTITEYPMDYSSASLAVNPQDETVLVLNGASTGNEIGIFTFEGEHVQTYPGWYNWPHDIVLGRENQLLLSALGAMGDDMYLRFGLVMYDSKGDFFHGFHEADTGLVRPFGLATIPHLDTANTSLIAVSDWGSNQTRFIHVNWNVGTVTNSDLPVIRMPYPVVVAVSEDRVVIGSMVCCEEFHGPLIKIGLFSMEGEELASVKELPTGEIITAPAEVAFDNAGNILVVDVGLDKTLLFDSNLDYLGFLPEMGVPKAIALHDKTLFAIEDFQEGDEYESYVLVYNYSY